MGRKKEPKLTRQERIDILTSMATAITELSKSSKAFSYTLTSLGLLALGKARILSPGVTGTLQGVNTYIAISDVVEEGDSGFFGVGGMAELAAKGGSSIAIGALWGLECERRTGYGVDPRNGESMQEVWKREGGYPQP